MRGGAPVCHITHHFQANLKVIYCGFKGEMGQEKGRKAGKGVELSWSYREAGEPEERKLTL